MDFTTIIWAVVVLGALAIVFGLILAVAAKVFEVEVDPRLPEIQACLAGANCGTNAVKNFEYRGVQDCLAATKVCGGDALACKYGCLGFGSCVAACKFDALHIGPNGAAVVDKEKCTNCGACREACPRKLIVEVPYSPRSAPTPASAAVCASAPVSSMLSTW